MSTETPFGSVTTDPQGKTRLVDHSENPFVSESAGLAMRGATTPEQLADEYVSSLLSNFGLDAGMASDLESTPSNKATAGDSQLHRSDVKEVLGSFVVDYEQSYRGLPVFGADLAVHVAPQPMRVTSSVSAIHEAIQLGNDARQVAKGYEKKLTKAAITGALGLTEDQGVKTINGLRPVIYLYNPEDRLEQHLEEESFDPPTPLPPLPPLPAAYIAGVHYAVIEALFDLAGPAWHHIHWRALIDPLTMTVLYLRPLVAAVTGMIFKLDPVSLSGDGGLAPASGETTLNTWRSNESLLDLLLHSPQDLKGSKVDLQEIENPLHTEPTTTAPFAFAHSAKTPEFAAVNAYYHVNWFFRLMEGMGFNLATYFDHTSFPVPVDHWSLGLDVNAHCPGNPAGNGIGHFCFGVAQAGENVGIADDVRVVIHEFGHALLWDHVNSPNFGFAHSAGDGLGAILMDPDSIAPDRFLTFPWPRTASGMPLNRRHDRTPAGGWAWFGPSWNTQYGGEQVLSSTLFRVYQSVGGDSPFIADRRWAARYVSFLILKAIGLMTATTTLPDVYANNLMQADRDTIAFEGHTGGALHKVIRWAFEKQGLYQPPGAPTPPMTAGAPPAVDVYIDDGRHGEYPYLFAFWECFDMWCRRAPDGGATHQNPRAGQTNYMYVRVKNRGTQAATNVKVKAYHADPSAGLRFPDDWAPMDTPELSTAAPIPPGGQIVVGPFAFVPATLGHECLLAVASATGDAPNTTTIHGSIPHARLVPFDNNIGQRNVCVVLAEKWESVLKELRKQKFVVANPFPRAAEVEILPLVPKAMRKEIGDVVFANAGGQKFKLGPLAKQDVIFSARKPVGPIIERSLPIDSPIRVRPGLPIPFGLLDTDGEGNAELDETAATSLRLVTLVDGQNMGGMTYLLARVRQPDQLEEAEVEAEPEAVIEKLRQTLSRQDGVKNVRVKGVTIEIELED